MASDETEIQVIHYVQIVELQCDAPAVSAIVWGHVTQVFTTTATVNSACCVTHDYFMHYKQIRVLFPTLKHYCDIVGCVFDFDASSDAI